jgi:hypothetical protein
LKENKTILFLWASILVMRNRQQVNHAACKMMMIALGRNVKQRREKGLTEILGKITGK